MLEGEQQREVGGDERLDQRRERRRDQQELQHRGLPQIQRRPLADAPEGEADDRRHGRDGKAEDEGEVAEFDGHRGPHPTAARSTSP